MKKLAVGLLCFCFMAVSGGVVEVYASGHSKDGYTAARQKKGADLSQKFYYKTKMIMKNAHKLGLTDAQKEDIKNHKYAFKKSQISNKAEIDLACLEVSKELWKEDIDVAKAEVLIE